MGTFLSCRGDQRCRRRPVGAVVEITAAGGCGRSGLVSGGSESDKCIINDEWMSRSMTWGMGKYKK